MVRAIKERIVIGPEGRVVIGHSELPEGHMAEVIVLLDERAAGDASRPLASFVGAMAGQFGSQAEADLWLGELRDEWGKA